MANLSLLPLLVLPGALGGAVSEPVQSCLLDSLGADGPYLLTVAVGTTNLWKYTETINYLCFQNSLKPAGQIDWSLS